MASSHNNPGTAHTVSLGVSVIALRNSLIEAMYTVLAPKFLTYQLAQLYITALDIALFHTSFFMLYGASEFFWRNNENFLT